MKKTRKVLSIVLALVMIFSTVSAALLTFAAEKPAKVAAFEDFINNAPNLSYLSSIPAKPDPTNVKKYPQGENDPKYITDLEKYNNNMALRAAALKWNDDAIAQYKALSESEKDAVDVKVALTFLSKTSARMGLDIREEGLTKNSTESQQMAYEKFDEVLGTHKTRADAYEIAKVLRDNPIDDAGKQFLSGNTDFVKYPKANEVFAKYLEAAGKASPLVRAYAGGITVMTGFAYYGGVDQYKLAADVANMFVKQAFAAHPYTEAEPEKAVKPKAGDFATTEEFEAAYEEYIQKDLAYKTWDANRATNFSAPFAVDNIVKFLEDTEELKALAPVLKAVYKEASEFVKTGDMEGCKEAKAAYSALAETEKAQFDKLSATVLRNAYIGGQGTKAYVSTMQYSISKLVSELDKAADMTYVKEFEEYVMAIDLNKVDNEKVFEAYDKYNEVPSSVRKNISAEAMDKYNAVLDCYDPVKPLTPSDDIFEDELAGYKKTNVKMPFNPIFWQKNGVKKVMDPVFDLVNIENTLNTGVYTNYAVGQILNLYTTIANSEIDPGLGINIAPILGNEFAPSNMQKALFEEKYAPAIEKIFAAVEAGEAADPDFKAINVYPTIHWDNGDFGFQDGDRDGFINAVLAVLRPVTKLLSEDGAVMGFIKINVKMTDWETADVPHKGDYNYGLYARLIPALEGLGLKVPSSKDYTAAYRAAYTENKYLGYDALLRPILEAVSNDILAPLAADPMTTLMNLAVRFADSVGSGTLDASVKDALGNCGGLLAGLAGALDLSADGVNNMLTAAPLSLPVNGTTVTLQLNPINWTELANCADVKLARSNSYTNAFRVERTADINRTFTHVFYYLYDVVFANADNYASVRDAVAAMEGGAELVKFTDKLQKIGPVKAYAKVMNTVVVLDVILSLIDVITGK